MDRIKVVRAKGRRYCYFKTARLNAKGKPVYIRMPDPADRHAFGAAYASAIAGLNRKSQEALTVTQLIDMYQRSPDYLRLSKGSRKVYDIYLRQFAAGFPTAPAEKIERRDVAHLIDKRSATPGAAESIRRTIAVLYRWGRMRGHVEADPCKDIETIKTGEHMPWPEHVLQSALESDDARIRLIVSLLYFTGQRIGDVAGMRWTDIRDDVLSVTQQKTGTALDIAIHPRLKSVLDGYARGLTTIIAQPNGKPYDRDTLRHHVQDWAQEHHGIRVVPHGLRKNAVNALLECGCSVAEVSSITGQSLQIVEHYAKHRNRGNLAKSAVLKWTRGNG